MALFIFHLATDLLVTIATNPRAKVQPRGQHVGGWDVAAELDPVSLEPVLKEGLERMVGGIESLGVGVGGKHVLVDAAK